MSEKPLFEDIKQELIAQNREPEEIEQIEKHIFCQTSARRSIQNIRRTIHYSSG